MEICEDKAYRAYLLRCWQDEPTAWRFSVEEVRAKSRRRGLRDLEELIAFLAPSWWREKNPMRSSAGFHPHRANNLVSGDTNNFYDIFVHDHGGTTSYRIYLPLILR
jgi:hypothetical protein